MIHQVTTSDNKLERVVQQMTKITIDNKRQRIREEPTTIYLKYKFLNIKEDLEEKLLY